MNERPFVFYSKMGKKGQTKRLTIAIDGPSGAGKSTVGKALAERLGYLYIDTGAMYRAVALWAKEMDLAFDDDSAWSRLVPSLHIEFVRRGQEMFVFCNGRDVTEAIRSPEISRLASEISKKKVVRDGLVEKQREMGRGGGVVLEGRDIGTVVFPDADVKFYLDADVEERARRRFRELTGKGMRVDFDETLEEVAKRDENDMNRALSPLRKAEDAFYIDSTTRNIEEVVDQMVERVRVKEGER